MSSSKATKNMGVDLSSALAEMFKDIFKGKHVKYVEKAIQEISSEDFQGKMTSIIKKNIQVSKVKKLKDPEAPKGRSSSYIFFCKEERQKVKDDNDGISNKDILVELGSRWKNLSDKKKKKFQKLAEADAERYKTEMANYTPSDEFKVGVGKKKNAKKEGPKRAWSAYIFFCAAERPKVKKEYKDMDSKEVMLELVQRWKALDDEDKEEYNQQAEEAKEKYLKEKEAWDEVHSKDEERSEDDVKTEEGSEDDVKTKPSPKNSYTQKDEESESSGDSDSQEDIKQTRSTEDIQNLIDFTPMILAVLDQVHPHDVLKIKPDASDKVNKLLNNVTNNIMKTLNTKDEISPQVLQHIIISIIPGELYRHAASQGSKFVNNFIAATAFGTSSEKNYGLIFDQTIFNNMMTIKDDQTSIYFAAAIEYLCAEILETAGNITLDKEKKTIKVKHVQDAIDGDEELSLLFKTV